MGSRFIELATSKKFGTGPFVTEVFNCDLIRRVWDRPGYGEPMVNVEIDAGTRGHWEANGANSIFKEIHAYGSYAEIAAALTKGPSNG